MKIRSQDTELWLVILLALFVGSCSNESNTNYVLARYEALASDGHLLDGRPVAVVGCVRANSHGMVLIDCVPGSRRIPLEPPDSSKRSGYADMYEIALRSQIGPHPLPKAYVCGLFHLAPKKDGRWIDVESMSSSGFPKECGPISGESNTTE